MWISAKLYFRLVFRAWFLVLDVLMIGLTLASGVWKPLEPTKWVWLTLLALGFWVSNLWAFHEVRADRDEVRRKLTTRPETVRHIHEKLEPVPGNFFNMAERVKWMRERKSYENATLNALHAEFLETQSDAPVPVKHKTAPLPKDWVEKRLEEMGEDWRRDDYWPPR
jgi:hypothetical protein